MGEGEVGPHGRVERSLSHCIAAGSCGCGEGALWMLWLWAV